MDTVLDVLSVDKTFQAYYVLHRFSHFFTIPNTNIDNWYSTGIFSIKEQRFEIFCKRSSRSDVTLCLLLKPHFYCSSKTFGQNIIFTFYYMRFTNTNRTVWSETFVHSYSKSFASESIEEFKHHFVFHLYNMNYDDMCTVGFYIGGLQAAVNTRMDATWQLWDDEDSFIRWISEEVLDDIMFLLADDLDPTTAIYFLNHRG